MVHSRYIYVFLFSLLGLAWSVLGHYTYVIIYTYTYYTYTRVYTYAHSTYYIVHIHTHTARYTQLNYSIYIYYTVVLISVSYSVYIQCSRYA